MSEIVRIEQNGIEFFTIVATGELGLSCSSLAKLSGVTQTSISRLIPELKERGVPKQLISWKDREIYLSLDMVKRGGKLKLVRRDFARDVVKYFYSEGFCSTEGADWLGMPLPKIGKKKAIGSPEREYRDKLAAQLNGQTEVSTLAGNVDVLTATELIEVKECRGWKSAIGQALVYGKYFPKHKKRIHLFGRMDEVQLKFVSDHAKEFDITVTWEL